MTQSTGNATVAVITPVLFYDFNKPPRNGIHWCLTSGWANLTLGRRVKFGCESDEVMAYGTVASVDHPRSDRLVGIRFEEWA